MKCARYLYDFFYERERKRFFFSNRDCVELKLSTFNDFSVEVYTVCGI